jgi:hypothetical protein
MSNWERTKFVPKWARNSQDRELLSEMPDIGRAPPPLPSVTTRIFPVRGGSRISASTLGDMVLLKQRIVNYVAYEVVRGIDPAFSDLRKIDDDCLQLARLDVEPFDEGSFIVPAELCADPIVIQDADVARTISATDIVERLNVVMQELPQQGVDFNVSMGLLTEINSLNKLLKRDVASLELMTTLPREVDKGTNKQTMRHCVDQEYLKRVESIRSTRQRTRICDGEELVGALVALDFESRKLKIKLDFDNGLTVTGSFPPQLESQLVPCLMKNARFVGKVRFEYRTPKHIEIVKVVPI